MKKFLKFWRTIVSLFQEEISASVTIRSCQEKDTCDRVRSKILCLCACRANKTECQWTQTLSNLIIENRH